MTIIYLMRHSRGMLKREDTNVTEPFQITNEKYILSVEGEKRALAYSNLKELQGLNCVVSSNYVRTMATAKYMALKNDLPIIVDESFNERKFGVEKREDLPSDFFLRQIADRDYKLNDGESFNEVRNRMLKGLIKIIKKNKNKKSLIVSHGSSMAFMLSKWCDIEYSKNYIIKFKDKVILKGFDSPELLELKFNDSNKLVNIRRIHIKKIDNKVKK